MRPQVIPSKQCFITRTGDILTHFVQQKRTYSAFRIARKKKNYVIIKTILYTDRRNPMHLYRATLNCLLPNTLSYTDLESNLDFFLESLTKRNVESINVKMLLMYQAYGSLRESIHQKKPSELTQLRACILVEKMDRPTYRVPTINAIIDARDG